MFRAIPCSSSGGQIVFLQHLLSSLSVSSFSLHRLRADCSPLSTGALNRVTIPDAVTILCAVHGTQYTPQLEILLPTLLNI